MLRGGRGRNRGRGRGDMGNDNDDNNNNNNGDMDNGVRIIIFLLKCPDTVVESHLIIQVGACIWLLWCS